MATHTLIILTHANEIGSIASLIDYHDILSNLIHQYTFRLPFVVYCMCSNSHDESTNLESSKAGPPYRTRRTGAARTSTRTLTELD